MTHSHNQPSRRRGPRIAWLSVTAMAAALTVAASAVAAPAHTPIKNPSEEPVGERVDVAVASYASDYSVTHEEAQRRLDRIQPLQEVLASIRDLEETRLAGWGIDHAGAFTGWVWLTGDDAPSTEAARIAAAHADVQIRTGAAHTLNELLTAQTGLFQGVSPTGHVTGDAESLAQVKSIVTFTDIDMAINTVRIGIDPALAPPVPGDLMDPDPIAVTDETLQAKITEVTQQFQDHIDVKFSVEDGRGMSVSAAFKGGEPVTGTLGQCTSGFAAQDRATGVYGIITAAHCSADHGDSLAMHGVPLAEVERVYGPYVDAQFHSIPTGQSHRLFDDYLCEERDPCDVSGDAPRSRMINAYLCHYGRYTQESCGTVISIFFTPSHPKSCENTCSNSFIFVHGSRLKGCDGDSGGPWYYDGTAYGIHNGDSDGTDCVARGKYSYFSPIQSIERILGIDILTDGYVEVS